MAELTSTAFVCFAVLTVLASARASSAAQLLLRPGYSATFSGVVPRGKTKDPGCNSKTVKSGGLGVYYSLRPAAAVVCSFDTCSTTSFETYLETYANKVNGKYSGCVANVDMVCHNGNLMGSLQNQVHLNAATNYTLAVLANAARDGGPFKVTIQCAGKVVPKPKSPPPKKIVAPHH